MKYFFRECDQIRRKLRIWSHLLKKSLMENFIFCGVHYLRNWVQVLSAIPLKRQAGILSVTFKTLLW